MKAYWSDEESTRTINSAAQLHLLIDELERRGRPMMLFLEHDCQQTLVIGIGSSDSVLTFIQSDKRTFHSVGDAAREGMLAFWCREQLDEFYAEMAVPVSHALDAADLFLTNGLMPANIKWEADW